MSWIFVFAGVGIAVWICLRVREWSEFAFGIARERNLWFAAGVALLSCVVEGPSALASLVVVPVASLEARCDAIEIREANLVADNSSDQAEATRLEALRGECVQQLQKIVPVVEQLAH